MMMMLFYNLHPQKDVCLQYSKDVDTRKILKLFEWKTFGC